MRAHAVADHALSAIATVDGLCRFGKGEVFVDGGVADGEAWMDVVTEVDELLDVHCDGRGDPCSWARFRDGVGDSSRLCVPTYMGMLVWKSVCSGVSYRICVHTFLIKGSD